MNGHIRATAYTGNDGGCLNVRTRVKGIRQVDTHYCYWGSWASGTSYAFATVDRSTSLSSLVVSHSVHERRNMSNYLGVHDWPGYGPCV